MLGCGPQATLLAPTLLRRAARAATNPPARPDTSPTLAARTVRFLDAAIALYQTEISPNRPATCRYEPSCLQYARQALQHHGLLRGTTLTVTAWHAADPGAPGGHDPAPPPRRTNPRRTNPGLHRHGPTADLS